MMNSMIPAAVTVTRLSKYFGLTRALDCIDFDVAFGEIHALVGENGAGKSTLIRILSGVHRPDGGEVLVEGRPCRFMSPRDAIAAGIVSIPQELRLVPTLSIAENIMLGDLPVRRKFGVVTTVDRPRMRQEALAVLAQLDYAPDPDLPVARLGFAERQVVAIGKALRRRCRIFVLDEPTAALESREIERLFAVLRRMQAIGTAIIYISHRLEEVVSIADRCTILRDGRVIAVAKRGEFSVADLIGAMTGRHAPDKDDAALETGEMLIQDAAHGGHPIAVHAHEIVGLAGLLGSGADQMLGGLFGAGKRAKRVHVRGEPRCLVNPSAAISAGIGFVPGERALGLVMNQSVRDNILLPSLDRMGRVGRHGRGRRLGRAAADRLVRDLMHLLDIRPRRPNLPASALSGGNQQKVILAKWLARDTMVLLLDEPTQGVDVAAKAQIHTLIRDFVRRGGGALVSSSDLGELVRLCGSVLAVRGGRITERLDRAGGIDEPQLRTAIGG